MMDTRTLPDVRDEMATQAALFAACRGRSPRAQLRIITDARASGLIDEGEYQAFLSALSLRDVGRDA